jgi:phage shock protein A
VQVEAEILLHSPANLYIATNAVRRVEKLEKKHKNLQCEYESAQSALARKSKQIASLTLEVTSLKLNNEVLTDKLASLPTLHKSSCH